MIHHGLTHLLVPIDSLHPHPRNPRRGNVAAIVESLQANGQYRPVVADQHRRILAGNHTWLAAKQLGWTDIAASFVDATEDQAVRILLADNRLSDLASYDDVALVDLLDGLPDLAGTGYDDVDLARLRQGLDEDVRTVLEPPRRIEAGGVMVTFDPATWDPWVTALKAEHPKRADVIAELQRRLGLS